MEKELEKISDYWEEVYSSKIKEYRPFELTPEFQKYASIFSLGNSYLYIVNLHNFKLEYISESVTRFVNKRPENIQLPDLLATVVPEEIEVINLKSRVISDFYTNYLERDNVLNYKNVFSYRMKDGNGKLRSMLYQAFPLSVHENGTPEHVFCIQTDVSHLKIASTNTVSFIHMLGGRDYFNVQISKGKFDPELCDFGNDDLSEILTEREKEIINKLAKGQKAEDIASELNLSPHTIKTHRRNILHKTGCSNTAELVAKCLTNGVISPGLN